jgi:hypothetical protein
MINEQVKTKSSLYFFLHQMCVSEFPFLRTSKLIPSETQKLLLPSGLGAILAGTVAALSSQTT